MWIKSALAGALGLVVSPAVATEAPDYSLLGDWPVKTTTESGVEIGLKGNLSYDYNRFGDDERPGGGSRFADDDAWRRQELNAYLRKPGVFEIAMGYDLRNKVWLDNFVRLSSRVGGDVRIGHFKTPVGYEEAAVGTASTTFVERSLPVSTIFAGRRLGVDWTYEQLKGWYLNAAVMSGGDLLGDNAGRTLAARVVFNPVHTDSDLVHLGLSGSNEKRDDDSVRIRVRPEAFLTPTRLVDSGVIGSVEAIHRQGLEAIWQHGPLLLQSEYLRMAVQRGHRPDYEADGYYVSGAWVVTGEKRSYKSAAFGNVKPKREHGALELALRYSTVDIDHGLLNGGREKNWTLGVNWYLGQHVKLQGNYVRVDSKRRGVDIDPSIVELRAQIYF